MTGLCGEGWPACGIRWLGVVIAFLACFLAAPGGTRYLTTATRNGFGATIAFGRRLASRATEFVRRRVFRRAPRTHYMTLGGSIGPTGSVSLGGEGALTATGYVSGPIEEQVDWLVRKVLLVEAELADVRGAVSKETQQRDAEVARLEAALAEAVADLRDALTRRERDAYRVDARALPAVAVGILLGGIPGELAMLPLSGVVVVCLVDLLALAVAVRSFLQVLTRLNEPQPSS